MAASLQPRCTHCTHSTLTSHPSPATPSPTSEPIRQRLLSLRSLHPRQLPLKATPGAFPDHPGREVEGQPQPLQLRQSVPQASIFAWASLHGIFACVSAFGPVGGGGRGVGGGTRAGKVGSSCIGDRCRHKAIPSLSTTLSSLPPHPLPTHLPHPLTPISHHPLPISLTPSLPHSLPHPTLLPLPSLLGTWSGPSWTPDCTVLQLLVSIQSMILGVENPVANEPSHEVRVKSGGWDGVGWGGEAM